MPSGRVSSVGMEPPQTMPNPIDCLLVTLTLRAAPFDLTQSPDHAQCDPAIFSIDPSDG